MPTTDNRSWTLTKLQTFVGQIKSWVSGKVKNNLTTTTAGDMLDATQGKVLDEKITDTAKLSGIVEDGTTATHAIAKGQFVVWQMALYTADAAISVGETLAATGGSKNLTAEPNGGLNALNASLEKQTFTLQHNTTIITSSDVKLQKNGNAYFITGWIFFKENINADNILFYLPTGLTCDILSYLTFMNTGGSSMFIAVNYPDSNGDKIRVDSNITSTQKQTKSTTYIVSGILALKSY